MKKLFDLKLYQGEDIYLEGTCAGDLLLSPTGKGSFCGGELNGEVVPMGMGITYTPCQRENTIKTSILLQTEDGAYVIMGMKAYLDLDVEQEEQLMRGEAVSPEDYYYKGIVDFKTGSTKYKWLERKVCVCNGKIESWDELLFEIFLI